MKTNFWQNKKVLVTGGAGFIGSHVVEKLVEKKANVTVLDNLQNGKLANLQKIKNKIIFINGDCQDRKTARKSCQGKEVVMNLAARVGGIEFNRTHQATMLKDNLLIATNMIEAAKDEKVERFLVISSACVYPHDCLVPTSESEGFMDEPEQTNGGYGWAKRMAEKLGYYYQQEFGIKVGIVRPYNCYGPRDHVDLETSHVIPALIKRIFDRENPVKVWGSGKQSRAFLYVEDLAEGMIMDIEKYPVADAINLGTDEEISIGDLVKTIIKMSGIKTSVIFDTTKPDGSPRRNSNNKKAQEKIGFKAKIPLLDGLEKTIRWYKNAYRQ